MKTKMKKYQAGGRTISEKAAMRKVGKGKGTIAYKYGSDSAPGTEGNKGEYIGYSRKARKDSASGKTMGTSMKDAKPARPVMQSGGTSEGYPGSGLSKIASKMTPKPGAGYKNPVKGPGREGRPASKGYDAYKRDAIEKAGGEDNARQAGYIKKTGGMVNSNAKVQALKSAGSKGVKPGVNPKAAASKVAKGRSGGTSIAPKKAVPGKK